MLNGKLENSFISGQDKETLRRTRTERQNYEELSKEFRERIVKDLNTKELQSLSKNSSASLTSIQAMMKVQGSYLRNIDNTLKRLVKINDNFIKALTKNLSLGTKINLGNKASILGSYATDNRKNIIKENKEYANLSNSITTFTDVIKKLDERQRERTNEVLSMLSEVPTDLSTNIKMAIDTTLRDHPVLRKVYGTLSATAGNLFDWSKQGIIEMLGLPNGVSLGNLTKIVSWNTTGKWEREVRINKSLPLQTIISLLASIQKQTWLINNDALDNIQNGRRNANKELEDKGSLKRFADSFGPGWKKFFRADAFLSILFPSLATPQLALAKGAATFAGSIANIGIGALQLLGQGLINYPVPTSLTLAGLYTFTKMIVNRAKTNARRKEENEKKLERMRSEAQGNWYNPEYETMRTKDGKNIAEKDRSKTYFGYLKEELFSKAIFHSFLTKGVGKSIGDAWKSIFNQDALRREREANDKEAEARAVENFKNKFIISIAKRGKDVVDSILGLKEMEYDIKLMREQVVGQSNFKQLEEIKKQLADQKAQQEFAEETKIGKTWYSDILRFAYEHDITPDIKNAWKTTSDFFKNDWKATGDDIRNSFKDIRDEFVNPYDYFWQHSSNPDGVSAIFESLGGGLSNDASRTWGDLKTVLGGVAKILKKGTQHMPNVTVGAGSFFKDWWNETINGKDENSFRYALSRLESPELQEKLEKIKSGKNEKGEYIKGNGLYKLINDKISKLANSVQDDMLTLYDTFYNDFHYVIQDMQTIRGQLSGMFSDLDKISELPNNITKDTVTNFHSIATRIASNSEGLDKILGNIQITLGEIKSKLYGLNFDIKNDNVSKALNSLASDIKSLTERVDKLDNKIINILNETKVQEAFKNFAKKSLIDQEIHEALARAISDGVNDALSQATGSSQKYDYQAPPLKKIFEGYGIGLAKGLSKGIYKEVTGLQKQASGTIDISGMFSRQSNEQLQLAAKQRGNQPAIGNILSRTLNEINTDSLFYKMASNIEKITNILAAQFNGKKATPTHGTKRYFAEGGIVTGPINAVVGENGPEAILPLEGSKAKSWIGNLVEEYNNYKISHIQDGVEGQLFTSSFIQDKLSILLKDVLVKPLGEETGTVLGKFGSKMIMYATQTALGKTKVGSKLYGFVDKIEGLVDKGKKKLNNMWAFFKDPLKVLLGSADKPAELGLIGSIINKAIFPVLGVGLFLLFSSSRFKTALGKFFKEMIPNIMGKDFLTGLNDNFQNLADLMPSLEDKLKSPFADNMSSLLRLYTPAAIGMDVLELKKHFGNLGTSLGEGNISEAIANGFEGLNALGRSSFAVVINKLTGLPYGIASAMYNKASTIVGDVTSSKADNLKEQEEMSFFRKIGNSYGLPFQALTSWFHGDKEGAEKAMAAAQSHFDDTGWTNAFTFAPWLGRQIGKRIGGAIYDVTGWGEDPNKTLAQQYADIEEKYRPGKEKQMSNYELLKNRITKYGLKLDNLSPNNQDDLKKMAEMRTIIDILENKNARENLTGYEVEKMRYRLAELAGVNERRLSLGGISSHESDNYKKAFSDKFMESDDFKRLKISSQDFKKGRLTESTGWFTEKVISRAQLAKSPELEYFELRDWLRVTYGEGYVLALDKAPDERKKYYLLSWYNWRYADIPLDKYTEEPGHALAKEIFNDYQIQRKEFEKKYIINAKSNIQKAVKEISKETKSPQEIAAEQGLDNLKKPDIPDMNGSDTNSVLGGFISAIKTGSNYLSGKVNDIGLISSSYLPKAKTSLAESLARNAYNIASSMGGTISTGYCARGVKNALMKSGIISKYPAGNAWQMSSVLGNNSNFQDITGQFTTKQSLANAPRGSIIVWNKKDGASKYGHIAVSLGNGKEASDHVRNTIVDNSNRYGGFRVFYPVGKDNVASNNIISGFKNISNDNMRKFGSELYTKLSEHNFNTDAKEFKDWASAKLKEQGIDETSSEAFFRKLKDSDLVKNSKNVLSTAWSKTQEIGQNTVDYLTDKGNQIAEASNGLLGDIKTYLMSGVSDKLDKLVKLFEEIKTALANKQLPMITNVNNVSNNNSVSTNSSNTNVVNNNNETEDLTREAQSLLGDFNS